MGMLLTVYFLHEAPLADASIMVARLGWSDYAPVWFPATVCGIIQVG
jgi:hypothetical protein